MAARTRLTVADLATLKGQRQLTMLRVVTLDQAAAAQDAGIDELCFTALTTDVGPSLDTIAPRLVEAIGSRYVLARILTRDGQVMASSTATVPGASTSFPRRWQKSPNDSPDCRSALNRVSTGSNAGTMSSLGTMSLKRNARRVPWALPPRNTVYFSPAAFPTSPMSGV